MDILLPLAVTALAAKSTHAEILFGVDLFARNFTNDPRRGMADARFDLPLDLAGIWQIEAPNGALFNNFIWQECLEMTSTGPNAPLHHMIHDGKYVTVDKLGPQLGGGDGAWKAVIAQPTELEASYGAKSTSVFYADNTVPGFEDVLGENEYVEVAIRFVGSDGRFYFQQNSTHLGSGSAGGGNVLVFELNNTLPCKHPYDPSDLYCAEKSYEGEDATAFTPACCSEGYCGDTTAYTMLSSSLGSDNLGDCSSEASTGCSEDGEEGTDEEADATENEGKNSTAGDETSDESGDGTSTASSKGTAASTLILLLSFLL